MNKALELILGLILVVVPIGGAILYEEAWGIPTLIVLKGAIVLGLICIGLLFLLLGISDLKD